MSPLVVGGCNNLVSLVIPDTCNEMLAFSHCVPYVRPPARALAGSSSESCLPLLGTLSPGDRHQPPPVIGAQLPACHKFLFIFITEVSALFSDSLLYNPSSAPILLSSYTAQLLYHSLQSSCNIPTIFMQHLCNIPDKFL